MEINTQQMEALLHLQEQQAQFPRRNGSPAQDFEALLNQQIAIDGQISQQPKLDLNPATQTAIFNPLLVDGQKSDEMDADAAVMQAAFEQASGTLALWDSYAHTLGTSASDSALRDAYKLLEGIDAQVAQMRNNPAIGKSSALDSIVNELEILAAAEKFKFNRGDYIN